MKKDWINFLIPEWARWYTSNWYTVEITNDTVIKVKASLAWEILNWEHQTLFFEGDTGNLNLDTSEFLVEN